MYERLYRGIDDDPANFVQIKRWQQYQEREFVPPIIGADSSPYAFPARTATYEAANYATQELSVLGNINVAFGIITEEQRRPNYHTNLKWDNSLNIANTNRVRAFFKEILLLCRAKVALNGGNLAATQITWFAPLSFSTYQRNLYQREWDTLFHDVFKTTNSMPCMVESTAPYYYLTRRNIVTLGPGENAAFIDIGGGTTDVLLYADRKPVLSTSFRFAGNDLVGRRRGRSARREGQRPRALRRGRGAERGAEPRRPSGPRIRAGGRRNRQFWLRGRGQLPVQLRPAAGLSASGCCGPSTCGCCSTCTSAR